MTSNDPYYPAPDPSDDSPRDEGDGGFYQQVQSPQVSARVPDWLGAGVFATGVMVQHGRHEFILDFIQTTARPHLVVARVVLSPATVPSTLEAFRLNLAKYESRFGPVPSLPAPPRPAQPPSVQDIYDQLKLSDDLLSGRYANAAMISHSPTEFVVDFITGFYPKPAVSNRVYLAVPQLPRIIDSMQRSWDQFVKLQNGSAGGWGEPDNSTPDENNPSREDEPGDDLPPAPPL